MSEESKPKTQEQIYEEFLGALAAFLMARPTASVLVLAEVPGRGTETFSNSPSLSWCEGALRAGLRMTRRVEKRAIAATAQEVERIKREEIERIDESVEQQGKKAN